MIEIRICAEIISICTLHIYLWQLQWKKFGILMFNNVGILINCQMINHQAIQCNFKLASKLVSFKCDLTINKVSALCLFSYDFMINQSVFFSTADNIFPKHFLIFKLEKHLLRSYWGRWKGRRYCWTITTVGLKHQQLYLSNILCQQFHLYILQ